MVRGAYHSLCSPCAVQYKHADGWRDLLHARGSGKLTPPSSFNKVYLGNVDEDIATVVCWAALAPVYKAGQPGAHMSAAYPKGSLRPIKKAHLRPHCCCVAILCQYIVIGMRASWRSGHEEMENQKNHDSAQGCPSLV